MFAVTLRAVRACQRSPNVLKFAVIFATVCVIYKTMFRRKCIFCKILSGEAPGEIIYEDDLVACLKDINPASTHHYLIIPKVHIASAKALQPKDEPIFNRMIETIDLVVSKRGLDPGNLRTGFHWPPFTTVNHLHLHVISPIEKMGFVASLVFRTNSYWFVSTEYVKSRFESCS